MLKRQANCLISCFAEAHNPHALWSLPPPPPPLHPPHFLLLAPTPPPPPPPTRGVTQSVLLTQPDAPFVVRPLHVIGYNFKNVYFSSCMPGTYLQSHIMFLHYSSHVVPFKSSASRTVLGRGSAWQPLAVTEAYMGLDPQVFNSEVRRRALEWRQAQEEDLRTKLSATIKERVQAETQAYLTRMGILDTKNPVLKNLKVGTLGLCSLLVCEPVFLHALSQPALNCCCSCCCCSCCCCCD